jgi:HEAT repeat protein
VNVGVAAHITAAAAGGPRYDPTLSKEERMSATNGIWLCQFCGTLVDSDAVRYPVDVLRRWKSDAENSALREVESIAVANRANNFDKKRQDLSPYFGIERHGWSSLLAACKDQRGRALAWYGHKYDSSLYVPRDAEQKIDTWYRHAKMCILQWQKQEKEEREPFAQLLVVVDQSGAGKTNLVLHLAEEYGKDAPVIIVPGRHTIVDKHTLEREIVDAVGYPVDDITYHAKLYELCQIAQREGSPLLVIVEGVDENSDPMLMCEAIEQVLNACQDYPLLLLVTCRDAFWPQIQSPFLESFLRGNSPVRPGLYMDGEFEQACKKYFSQWKVEVELSVEAKESLRSPLLLSIFSEVNRGCSFKFVPSVVAKDLWEKYLEVKIDAIHDALKRRLSKQAIRTAVEDVALRMLERNSPALSFSEISILNRHIDPDNTAPHSLFLQLKNSGVFYEDTPQSISFVYETFLEYVVGQALAREFKESGKREHVLNRIDELARSYRWRQIPLYVTELISEPDALIERLHLSNIWLAAQAIRRSPTRVSPQVRQRLIADLEGKLESKFSLDRQRAADLLGVLGAKGSKDRLLSCLTMSKPASLEAQALLRALARFGVEDIVEPFIHYLGRFLEWHLPDDQELVDSLPAHFRHQLLNKALALLQVPEQMYAAAHAIGYLKAEQAVAPLLSHLETTEWSNWVALLTLVAIGTEEAFNALEIAFGRIGEKISAIDQRWSSTTSSPYDQEVDRQARNELYGILEVVRGRGIQHCPSKKITPFLVRLLEHPNAHVRFEAIQSIRHLGASDAALALIKSRPCDDWRPGFGIAEALTAFGRQIDIEPILALANDPTTPEMVVRDAIKALGVSRDKRVLEPLSAFIAQRRFLFEVIQALGDTELLEAIPLLIRVLEDDSIVGNAESFLNRENIEYFVVEELGKLQHPEAFEPVERYARKHLPTVGHMTLSALVATGGERAIPCLQEIWECDPDKRETNLRGLLWIGTTTAIDKVIELLQPIDGEKAALLAHALSNGRGLDFITGTMYSVGILEAIDSRLVAILDVHFDEMAFDGKWRAIIAMKYIANHAACQLLVRIATDPKYGEVLFPNARPGSFQTLRQAAIHMLCDLGSNVAIEAVLDALSDQPANVIEFRLAKMDYRSVGDAVQKRLHAASDPVLIRLLTLLGTFGDYTVLPSLQPYIDDPRQEVADAAYVAEQRILGLAYF